MKDAGLLAMRLTTGGLLAGHGAQKLFGSFGGYGLEGTGGWLESLGLKPGKYWAAMAGLSEFGGGLLSALGLFEPLGPLGTIAAMSMATGKAHWGKPIWATAGGAELPAVNMAVALAQMIDGPGRYSLDRALGLRLPTWLVVLAAAATAAGVTYGLTVQPEPAEAAQSEAVPRVQAEADAAATAV